MDNIEQYLHKIQLNEIDDKTASHITKQLVARDTFKAGYSKIKSDCATYNGADKIDCILNKKVSLLYKYRQELRKIKSGCKSNEHCVKQVEDKLQKIEKLIYNSKNQDYDAKDTETQ